MGRTADLGAQLAAGKTTKRILIISIALQLLCTAVPGLTTYLAFHPEWGALALPGAIIHMFAHGSWGHLMGNYMSGLPFMLYLESRIGSRHMWRHFISCGLFASLFSFVLSGSGGIGSSGAICGSMAGALMLYGENRWEQTLCITFLLMLLLPNILMIPLTELLGVGFAAHVGGMIGALILAGKRAPSNKR